MIVTKLVEFDAREVEIDITAGDIQAILARADEGEDIVKKQLNQIACFLRGIPDVTIEAMPKNLRKGIAMFLRSEAERFAERVP